MKGRERASPERNGLKSLGRGSSNSIWDKQVPLGYVKGTNLKAKNIIRRAYGYRDKESMKLKLI